MEIFIYIIIAYISSLSASRAYSLDDRMMTKLDRTGFAVVGAPGQSKCGGLLSVKTNLGHDNYLFLVLISYNIVMWMTKHY
jgi:hypothetical protein